MYEFKLEEIIENTLSEAFSLKGDLLKDYLIKRYMLLNKIKDTKNIDINSFSIYWASQKSISFEIFTVLMVPAQG